MTKFSTQHQDATHLQHDWKDQPNLVLHCQLYHWRPSATVCQYLSAICFLRSQMYSIQDEQIDLKESLRSFTTDSMAERKNWNQVLRSDSLRRWNEAKALPWRSSLPWAAQSPWWEVSRISDHRLPLQGEGVHIHFHCKFHHQRNRWLCERYSLHHRDRNCPHRRFTKGYCPTRKGQLDQTFSSDFVCFWSNSWTWRRRKDSEASSE